MGLQRKLLEQYTIQDFDDKHKDLIYREIDNDKLLSLLNKDDVILDGGAHIGAFSLAASTVCKKLYAYEPEFKNFNLLQENIIKNNIDNVEFFHQGMSDSTETSTIWLDPNRSMNATVFKKRTTTISEEIQLIDFKNILERHKDCTVLKMDIEGSEYPIFIKYFDLIAAQFRAFAVEFHLDNVGVKIGQKSKREDLDKWNTFVDLIKSKYTIIGQRNKEAYSYEDKKRGKVSYLRNGIDFITAVRINEN